MLLSAASVSSAVPSARRGRQQARLQRRVGGVKVSAAIQERRGSSPSRNREPERREDNEGISLFGKRVILRVEEPEPEPYYYDDEYDEPQRRRRPAPRRAQEKEGNALDGLLNVFAKKDERDEDPYDRFVREERRERGGEGREGREGRRTVGSRSPSPRREYVDDYDYDERPRSRNGNGNGGGPDLLAGLTAFTAKAQDLAGELKEAFREEEKPVRRTVGGSRDEAPRRRLVRRDEDEERYEEYDYFSAVTKKQKGLQLSRRSAIGAALLGAGAVAATGYVGTGTYQKNIAMSMAMDMVTYEDALAERKKYLFLNLAGCESVLEVGVGTGPNMTYYPSSVETVIGIDTNEYMRPYAEVRAQRAGRKFSFLKSGAEDMAQVPDSSVDAVVSTIALCCVADPQAALSEISRVLRPGGAFLFIEHVAADASKEPLLALAQRVIDPFQQVAAGGCHLTRDTGGLIRSVSRMVETPEGIARWGPPPRSFLSGGGRRQPFLFDRVMIEEFSVPGMNLISPHISGIAFKPELDFL